MGDVDELYEGGLTAEELDAMAETREADADNGMDENEDTGDADELFSPAPVPAVVSHGMSMSMAMERTGSSSARSTPDPVLGKRRFDDFRHDAPTAG